MELNIVKPTICNILTFESLKCLSGPLLSIQPFFEPEKGHFEQKWQKRKHRKPIETVVFVLLKKSSTNLGSRDISGSCRIGLLDKDYIEVHIIQLYLGPRWIERFWGRAIRRLLHCTDKQRGQEGCSKRPKGFVEDQPKNHRP